MSLLKNLPLDKKLRLAILLTASLALAVAGIGLGVYDFASYSRIHQKELESLSKVLSVNIISALEFNDPDTGNKILHSLTQDPRVNCAAIYDANGGVFARYTASEQNAINIPRRVQASGFKVLSDSLQYYHSLPLDSGANGTLMIEMNQDEFYNRIYQYLLIVLGVLAVSFWGAYYFSTYMERLVSQPLLQLATVATKVSQEKNYGYRAKKEGDDEVGMLTDRFNDMLDQIQSREQALQDVQNELENRVRERTSDLVQINQRMQFEIGIRKRAEEIVRSHYRVLEMLTAGQSLPSVLDSLNEAVEKQVGPDVYSSIWLLDEPGERLLVQSAPHLPENFLKQMNGMRIGLQQGSGPAAVHKNSMVIVEDIETDPLWGEYRELALAFGLRACWAFLISDTQNKVLGVLCIFCDKQRSPTVEELQMVKSSTFLAGTAISRRKTEDELKNYARELARSNQDLEDFASIASHDLQEPLRKVIAFGQRLMENSADNLDAKGKDYVERMMAASGRMKGFIDDLLAYSRIGARSRVWTPINLNQLVADVLFDLELRIHQLQAEVIIGDLPVLEGDGTQIRQVFQNLIGNALKFNRPEEKPRIEISYRKISEEAEFEIKDNGIGFEETFRERIFKPFERLHARNQFEGSGMGLALVKKIVERHGGQIFARSTPGQGTSMIFRLPFQQKRQT